MAKQGSTRGQGRTRPSRRRVGTGRLPNPVLPLDAEDIALARLQAHLRKTEDIQASPRPASEPPARASVRLSAELLKRARERAAREGMSLSDLVEAALARYLRSS